MVESGARALADQFHDELAGLVTGTLQRWDAAETSSQLELLLGRDLQFIRINGTVVGGWRGPGPARHRLGPGLIHAHLAAGPGPARQRVLPGPAGTVPPGPRWRPRP